MFNQTFVRVVALLTAFGLVFLAAGSCLTQVDAAGAATTRSGSPPM